jgi:hypothetical protein
MKPLCCYALFLFLLFSANAQSIKRAKPLNVFHVPCRAMTSLPFGQEKSNTKMLEPLGIDGSEVRVTSHELASEQIVFLEPCDSQASKPIVEDEMLGRHASIVRGFRSYEAKDRVFAYRFTCYAIMTKNGFVTERYGAAGDVYYIDETGNGTFDRYRGAMPLKFLPD